MLKISKYPDPILRKRAKAVVNFDQTLADLSADMASVMYQDDGIGLAAPQVSQSLRLLVIGNEEKKGYKVYVNPEITFYSKNAGISEEGCLSLPQIFGLVRRPKKIHIKYQDLGGNIHKEKLAGLEAIILQHEFDHLEGILFIDRAEKIMRGQEILDSLKP